MSKVERLNVKANVKKSIMYLGYHVATATLSDDEEVDLIATSHGVVVSFPDRKGITVEVPYEELVREALKVV
jgi:predicted peroxiredoxin